MQAPRNLVDSRRAKIENINCEDQQENTESDIIKLDNTLRKLEDEANSLIQTTPINYEEIIEWLEPHLTNFDIKTTKYSQFDKWSKSIENIYVNINQQINELEEHVSKFNAEKSSELQKDDECTQFSKYMKEFAGQISNARKELYELKLQLANENIKCLKAKLESKDQEIHTLTSELQQAKEKAQSFEEQMESKNQEISTLKKHKDELQQTNKTQEENFDAQMRLKNREVMSLRKETAKYQSALGEATNFRISDNDSNNTSQFARDIEDLKHLLDNFCSLKKVDINYEALGELLKKYSCSAAGTKPNKNLIKGILQRHVIEMVIENANDYLKIYDEKVQSLEKNLDDETVQYMETYSTSTINKLMNCIELFSTHRTGTDEVTQAATIKLRQLVYSVLGSRGFSEIPNKGEHPFIMQLRDLVVEDLNKYRTIKDQQKRSENKNTAIELIRQIISIFCFRLNIQEPIVEYKWYKNSEKIDLEFMECSFDDDNFDKIMVDVCSFPLIGTNLDHEENYKVIVRASVVKTDYVNPRILNNISNSFSILSNKFK
ncbi:9561_t:CDS:1 [Scutellospora calospora]|uniref:9561_t:CDS:1 n=1 Tax=Scutellospora calospora TaxID=85575 RepID=A0ACA9L969_9GLOM|nr:9561_t:CDS:1 [Scutellospora calospora]